MRACDEQGRTRSAQRAQRQHTRSASPGGERDEVGCSPDLFDPLSWDRPLGLSAQSIGEGQRLTDGRSAPSARQVHLPGQVMRRGRAEPGADERAGIISSVTPLDAACFSGLYEAEFARQVRRAALLTGSVDVAHDVVHDAFVAVYRRWDQIDTPAATSADRSSTGGGTCRGVVDHALPSGFGDAAGAHAGGTGMGGVNLRWTAALTATLVLAFTVTVVGPAPASAGGDHGEGGGHGSSCAVYPIAVKSSVLASARTGKVIDDLTGVTPSGHEGWLTWTGENGAPVLAKSLTPPGDDENYRNPDDPSDRHALRRRLGARPTGRRVEPRRARGTRPAQGRPHRRCPCGTSRGNRQQRRLPRDGFRQRRDHLLPAAPRTTASRPSTSARRRCTTPDAGPVAEPDDATAAEDQPVTITLTGRPRGIVVGPALPPDDARARHGGGRRLTGLSTQRGVRDESPVGPGWGWGPVGTAPDSSCRPVHLPTVTYTPSPDFYGADQFTFTVSDGRSDSAPAAVTITVSEVNDPPVAGPDSAAGGVGPVAIPAADLARATTRPGRRTSPPRS